MYLAVKNQTRYVVSWLWNGKRYSEEFEFQTLAELKRIQLGAYGIEASIHVK